MPPKRLQDEPSIDAPSGRSSYAEEGDEESSDAETKETRATHNAKLRKLVDEKEPLPLTFRKCDGRPTGQYSAMFANELGLAVRAHAPLSFDNWSKVPVERKMPILDRLKDRSVKNAANRAKIPFNHCGGSKSFVQHSYELGGGPSRVDRIALYRKTHFNSSTGKWAEVAEAIYNDMVELRERYRQKRVDDGLPPTDEFELASLVSDEVLGKRSGYIKGLEQGPRPSKSTSNAGFHKTTNAELREELTTTQEELERTRATLQVSQDRIQNLESTVEGNQRMMMQFFQKIAPDVLQALMGQSSSSSAPSL